MRSVVALGLLIMGMLVASPRVLAQLEAEPRIQPPPAIPASLPSSGVSVAVVSSGGAALGAYEGGYLEALTETLQANPDLARVRIATGTSAGSLNSLLTAVEACSGATHDPSQSWFYRVWTAPTFQKLYVREETTGTAMFSRRSLMEVAAQLEQAWNQGLPESCDIVLGVPVTRVIPREVMLHPPYQVVPLTLERFAVRVRGRGPGRPPELENYRDPRSAVGVPLLPIDGEQPDEFDSLLDLLFASAAFPLAFSPVELRHCVRADGDRTPCTVENATTATFVDGGVFENEPLGLAAWIARVGLEAGPDGRSTGFRPLPDNTQEHLPPGLVFVMLDPHTYAFPLLPEDDGTVPDDALGLSMRLADTFVNTARTSQLQRVLERFPGLRDAIRPTSTSYPPISSLLEDFFGMIDHDLLAFDYVLGMYDARRALRGGVAETMRRVHGDGFELTVPEPPPGSRLAKPLRCLEAVLDGIGDANSACDGDELRGFRAILQVTLERTYTLCRERGNREAPTDHRHCLAAMRGERPPTVPGVRAKRNWELLPVTDQTRSSIDRLVDYGFVFDELGRTASSGEMVARLVRERLGVITATFADVQPENSFLLRIALRAALDSLQYAPPRVTMHLVLGNGLEFGASFGRPSGHVPWLRLATVLRTNGPFDAIGTGDAYWRIAPAAGFEIDPTALNGGTVAWRFGQRVGYSFSTYDKFGSDACPGERSLQYRCSRMTFTTYAALTILGLARAQITFDAEPGLGRDQYFVWSIFPSLGFEWRSIH